MNARVRDHLALVESLATRRASTRAAKNARADYDDLVQEGLIEVWEALERGAEPDEKRIDNRMRRWVRRMARQRRGEISLDELLDAEDSRAVQSRGQQMDISRLVRPQE